MFAVSTFIVCVDVQVNIKAIKDSEYWHSSNREKLVRIKKMARQDKLNVNTKWAMVECLCQTKKWKIKNKRTGIQYNNEETNKRNVGSRKLGKTFFQIWH